MGIKGKRGEERLREKGRGALEEMEKDKNQKEGIVKGGRVEEVNKGRGIKKYGSRMISGKS